MSRSTEDHFRIVVKQLPDGQVSVQREEVRYVPVGAPIITTAFKGGQIANCIANSERGCLGIVYDGDEECSCRSLSSLRNPGHGCPKEGIVAG